jgi:hypothetical protein
MNDYEKLEAIHCSIQEASNEMRGYVGFHHKHDGGCSIEFEGASDSLKDALNLVEQIREAHPQAPWNTQGKL